MADESAAVRPLGSERFVDWGEWADGVEHTLWRGPRFEGYDFEQDVELARGAFLSWASRRGYVTRTSIDHTEGKWMKVQARPRQDVPAQRRSGAKQSAKQAKPNAVDTSTAGA